MTVFRRSALRLFTRLLACAFSAACFFLGVTIALSFQPQGQSNNRVFFAVDAESVPKETSEYVKWLKEIDPEIKHLVLSSRILEYELQTAGSANEANKTALIDKIKKAASDAGVTLLRLSIFPEPELKDGSNEAASKKSLEKHVEHAKLAAKLGCKQISIALPDFPGNYLGQKDMAADWLSKLLKALNDEKIEEVLVSSGTGLSTSAEWIGQVLDGARERYPGGLVTCGVLLDVAKIDFLPRTAFEDFTAAWYQSVEKAQVRVTDPTQKEMRATTRQKSKAGTTTRQKSKAGTTTRQKSKGRTTT